MLASARLYLRLLRLLNDNCNARQDSTLLANGLSGHVSDLPSNTVCQGIQAFQSLLELSSEIFTFPSPYNAFQREVMGH